MINPNSLERIKGYITEDDVLAKYLKNIPWQIMRLIYVSISSYCFIINSTKRIYITKQVKQLEDVIGNTEYYFHGENEESKNRVTEA